MIWIVIIIAMVFVLIPIGLRTVQQQERRLVELFGRYFMTLKPGLRWIFPGIMAIRASISIWEQTIPLFETPIKIDFQDGSATPKGAEVFVKVKNPDTPYDAGDGKMETGVYRAIYEINNWRTAIKNLVENAIRSYLNGLTIDKGITKKGAGFDLKNKFPPTERNRINKTLDCWGFELLMVTVMDFDLEPDLVKARGEVQKRRREKDGAIEIREIRALETMGSLISMISTCTGKTTEEVQGDINASPDLKRELMDFGKELITRRMSIDGESLTDIMVQGGGELEQSFLRLIAGFKKL